jgi:mannose-1-phosphate guanylyltransferase
MKAVIQAGGMGTRLRPITYEIPKPLLPVRKRPIVNHLIDMFLRGGVEEVALLISADHAEDFRRWRKAWDDVKGEISIFIEEKPRGTFGGLELLRGWLGQDPFFMSNADDLKEIDLRHMLAFHDGQGGLATIALASVPDPHNYGVPVMEGAVIRQFLEKPAEPPCNLINAGVYVLEPEVMDLADFSQPQISIERDIFPGLASRGKLMGYEMSGRWFDCGNLERWEQAMKGWKG